MYIQPLEYKDIYHDVCGMQQQRGEQQERLTTGKLTESTKTSKWSVERRKKKKKDESDIVIQSTVLLSHRRATRHMSDLAWALDVGVVWA